MSLSQGSRANGWLSRYIGRREMQAKKKGRPQFRQRPARMTQRQLDTSSNHRLVKASGR